MTRGLSAAQQTAAVAPHRAVAVLIEMAFGSGTLRLAVAPFDVVDGGFTYVATGTALQVNALAESSTSREGVSISLSGLDPAIIAIANSEQFRGRMLTIRKLIYNPDTNVPIGTSVIMWIGRIRSMSTSEDNSQAGVQVTAEHFEAELGRAAPLRLNDADQQRLYPGDLGCQYAEETVSKNIVFPSKEALRR